MQPVVNIISLGCSKNLVDSERLMKMLCDAGFNVRFESDEKCDAVVINTCGFIGDAKEESVNTILLWCKRKSQHKVKKVIVMGCLSERYKTDLPESIPEVDKWFGKFDWHDVVNYLSSRTVERGVGRILTTPAHSAYIKIAEGCNRFCAFCAIPLITGRYKSRAIEDIVAEVTDLVATGVHEFNIIAQDLSDYGVDIYGKQELAHLIERIADIDGVEWIRLHYLYPHDFPYDILPIIASRPNVCKYIDIALQHISNPVLANMRRHISSEQTIELLKRIRAEVPGIHIRTTLMVGFPGETDSAFAELLKFVREQKFERMGAFAYCEEEDTYAAKHFEDSIPQDVKQERLDKLMALQEQISDELQQQKVGCTLRVVIDSREGNFFVCRSEFDSPEVDPVILVPLDDNHNLGEFHNVRVTNAYPFELEGEFID